MTGKSRIIELRTTWFAFERVSHTKATMLDVVCSSIVQGLVRFKLMRLQKPSNTTVSPRSLTLGTSHERKTSLVETAVFQAMFKLEIVAYHFFSGGLRVV